MITIEEKLKLFSKIIYDKVEKENQRSIDDFNREFGNLIEQKKQEFIREANDILNKSVKNIEKERLQIISRAKLEEKKAVLEKKKEVFEQALEDMLKYARNFTETPEYKDLLLRDLNYASEEFSDSREIDVYLTEKDEKDYREYVIDIFKGRILDFINENDFIGGFIIVDRERSIKIDMSMLSRINSSREYIGESLFRILQ